MKDRFIATYRQCVQIGPDDYKMVATSKIFMKENNFIDVFDWLESLGVKDVGITSAEFSDLDKGE